MFSGIPSPLRGFQPVTRQPVATIRPNLPSIPSPCRVFPDYRVWNRPMRWMGVFRQNPSDLGVRAMRYCRGERFSVVVMTLVVFMVIARPAHAGIFSKHTKASPAERVPILIATLRAESDEHKRSAAAEELRQYDPAMFPEIIPSLADAAQHDPKSGVRMEAIQSLAKLRPVSQRAGAAIEQATHDESMRVRLQARTLLWQYHLAGYHGSKTPDIAMPANGIHTEEPPLATLPESAPVSIFQKPVPPPTVGYVSPA